MKLFPLSVALLLSLVLAAHFGAPAFTQSQDQELESEWRTVLPDWIDPSVAERKAFQRWWWAYRMRAGLGDEIPSVRDEALSNIAANVAATFPQVVNQRWMNLGPAPLTGGQIGTFGFTRPMSGRVISAVVDPSDPNHWYVGTAQGGVWETRNAGAAWIAKSDAQPSLAIGALAISPQNPRIVYAGTGEPNFSGDSYGGAGLLKSTDGGLNWTVLGGSTFQRNAFSDILLDPSNPNVIVVSIARAIFGRVSVFHPALPGRGIYRSTDGGATWSLRLGIGQAEATDLVVDPTNFARQYGGVGDPFVASVNNVYRSFDGGDTWTALNGPWTGDPRGIGRVELAISPSNPDRMFVSIQDAFGAGAPATDGGLIGLWYTNNAWAATPTWTAISMAPIDNGSEQLGFCGWDPAFGFPSRQCWYDQVLSVDPANPNVLFAGGVALWRYDVGTNIWSEVSQTTTNPAGGIHVDQHAMTWAGNRLISGNDGGVWSTLNGGLTWAVHNTTLAITQFYDGAIHPTGGNLMLGGSQDNGTEIRTNSNTWQWTFGGDGADNAISNSNPAQHWAVSAQGLNIFRTLNGGTSYESATSGINFTAVPFIARFEKCPTNDDVFIAGTDNVWRSNNFFTGAPATWADNMTGMNFASGISALAFAPAAALCNVYAFGTAGASIFRTTVGGGAFATNWVNMDPPASNQVPNRPVSDIAFDPSNSNIAYVTLSGFDNQSGTGPGHVFKTTNALSATPTWTNVSPPADMPANTVAVDPSNPNKVYVGTDIGVWYSDNGGTSWAHMGPGIGMPNIAVFELQHAGGRLVAFTHGRGAFALANFDINGDTLVDCADVAIVKAALGKRAGQAGFNTAADLSSDYIVDVRDLALLTRQLPPGTNCP